MAKLDVRSAITQRSPIGQREAIRPIDPYDMASTTQVPEKLGSQDGKKVATGDGSKSASREVRKPGSHEPEMVPSQEADQPPTQAVRPPAEEPWVKLGTFLRKGTKDQLKIRSVQEGREIREIIQQLVEEYLK